VLSLGRWLAQSQPKGWYYHQITNSVWEARSAQWVRHGGLAQCTWQQWFHINGTVEPPPPTRELQKATVGGHDQTLSFSGHAECKAMNTNMDFCQKLRSFKFALQWGLSINQQGSQSALNSVISSGLGYAVSDGSFKDERGSAAWIIKGPTSAL